MGKWHSVAVGYRDDDWRNPVWVMDILQSQDSTAAESLEHALKEEPGICTSLRGYVDLMIQKEMGTDTVEEAIEKVRQIVRGIGANSIEEAIEKLTQMKKEMQAAKAA